MTDQELLQEHLRTHSEPAFAELVQRHIDWIHSAALRQVHDVHLAEDVAQAVFIALARQAGTLRQGQALPAWLFRVTRCAAVSALRDESRRKHHEQKAAAMRSESTSSMSEAEWEELSPLLDELVARLGKPDQQVILLRFYQQKSLAEVGQAMAISEEAARKRVDRAVEKLRAMFNRRGVAVGSGAVLATALATHTTQAAPAGLLSSTTAAAMAAAQGAVISGQGLMIAKGAMKMMTWTKLKLAAVICAAVLVLAGIWAVRSAIAQKPASSPATGTGQSLGQIATGQRSQLARIRQLGMTFTAATERTAWSLARMRADDPTRYPTSVVYRFQMSGERFRTENWLPGSKADAAAERASLHLVMAFDLQKNQSFDKSAQLLTVTAKPNENGYSANVPTLSMYQGVVGEFAKRTFPALKDREVWDEWVHRSEIVGTSDVQGLRCVEVQSDTPSGNYKNRTWFAVANDYFPVRFECVAENGVVVHELSASQLKVVRGPDGNITIPMHITRTCRDEDSGEAYEVDTYTVDQGQLRVNESIPDDVFTIPRALARGYIDLDDPSKSDIHP